MEEEKRCNVPLKGTVKVGIKGREEFWEWRTMELLDHVQRYHSLKRACEDIGMSYSKGYKMIKQAEGELGFPLLNSERGGASGGSSVVTMEARSFAARYHLYHDSMKQHNENEFKKYFQEYF